MPKFNVRETPDISDAFDVFDASTGNVAIVNDTWLGAISHEDADDAADLLNAIHARRDGLLN